MGGLPGRMRTSSLEEKQQTTRVSAWHRGIYRYKVVSATVQYNGRMTTLPQQVRIVEVGPRDGLQNEQKIVPTEKKAEFIKLLVAAGLKDIEVASFVHPKWVPQLADAEELIRRLES